MTEPTVSPDMLHPWQCRCHIGPMTGRDFNNIIIQHLGSLKQILQAEIRQIDKAMQTIGQTQHMLADHENAVKKFCAVNRKLNVRMAARCIEGWSYDPGTV